MLCNYRVKCMRTNVMIRVDEETVRNAKALELNISKICEEALMRAVTEEAQPYGIVPSLQIIYDAEFFHYPTAGNHLAIIFTVRNTSEENVILDRIKYLVAVKKESGETVQTFEGTILDRRTIAKGSKEIFPEKLMPSPDLARVLKETTSDNQSTLKWIVFPTLIADSKKRILEGKFEQVWDEKQIMPRPRSLKIFK